MHPQCKELIFGNFLSLVKESDIKIISKMMFNKGVFTKTEIDKILRSDDERHNSRLFYFELLKKNQKAYNILIESFNQSNKKHLADLLQYKKSGCKVIQPPSYDEKEEISSFISGSVHVDDSITPLKVQVKYSDKFPELHINDSGLNEYYKSCSKKRGRLLMVNNYDFGTSGHPYRNGAEVDSNNLESLFNQMGGWDVQPYINKTAEQMKLLLKEFAENKVNKQYDICFVIIMSHGNMDKNNETIIYGVDDKTILESDIDRQFNNENCKYFRGKPKILLFQACRGSDHNNALIYTETDSRTPNLNHDESTVPYIRQQDDVLVGHSTLLGTKAHRDVNRGSWYIEILCEIFMNHSHNTPVDDLLSKVDLKLRRRMSERSTMQTSEHINKGFKKLYLNPGIFFENGETKKF